MCQSTVNGLLVHSGSPSWSFGRRKKGRRETGTKFLQFSELSKLISSVADRAKKGREEKKHISRGAGKFLIGTIAIMMEYVS